ncbi:pseudouridine synthase [Corynebacterium sp.]|uniref:pseudouridine synthase n=1 Tax=Corynebacterium sp. TaxID=1720 RepID=UPI0026DAFB25|nr:pseudouridine synthase [Corynebacterium sp.]MDO4611202.1 pseudouridine synthase [Corynebacterium sp.]
MPRSRSRRTRTGAPLPVRDGLNPSRIRVPGGPGAAPVTAGDLVAAAVAGQRRRHPDDGPEAVAARFAAGEVVDATGRPLGPADLLRPGTDVWFHRIAAPERRIAGPMPVLHADRLLVVVDKPHFLATTPRGAHVLESAVVRLRRELGEPDLVPAHRLDRLTAGVLLFVRDPAARGAYQGLFAGAGDVVKRYEALAPAPAAAPPRELVTRQDKTRGILQARTVPGEPNARTIVEGVEPRDGGMALWRLRPLTGRTHQLRLHLHDLGCPIAGDPLYPDVVPEGAEDPARPLRLLCRELAFDDPIDGSRRVFRSLRPEAGGA